MTQFFALPDLGMAVSQGDLLARWLQSMQTAFPGYNPSQSSPEYIQAQVFASWAADTAQIASAGATELFRQYGTSLLNLPYQQGVAASAVATITASDSAGHTLPAGTQVTLTLAGTPLAFQTASTLTIAAGATTGTVTVSAMQAGAAFNGATNPCQLVSQINWVGGVSVSAQSSGGVDQEDDDHYLQRLATVLQLLAPRPIVASDYATMALNFTPAAGTAQQLVGRSAAIDGYDPVSNTYGNQRTVAVCVTDPLGVALNTDTMYGVGGSSTNVITNAASWGVAGWLRSLREVNFVVNVVAPSYTLVYVAVQVKASPGFSLTAVQASVQSALLAYLTPANFGLPQGANVGWNNTTTVSRSRVESVIQNVLGVDRVISGTLAIDVNSNPTNTTGDLTLAGPFPLAQSSTTSIPLSAITVS